MKFFAKKRVVILQFFVFDIGRQSGFASGWDQNSGQRNVTFKDSFGTQNRLSALQQQPKQTGANQASGNIKDFTPAQLM